MWCCIAIKKQYQRGISMKQMSPEQQEKWAYRIMALIMLVFMILVASKGIMKSNEEAAQTMQPTEAAQVTATPAVE